MRVGYITSRFPKLTETFILYEILGLERAGVDVEFYPLVRENAEVVHSEALSVVARAHFLPFLSFPIIRSNLRLLWRAPFNYLATFAAVIRGTWTSSNFLLGAIGIFPKVAHAAEMMRRNAVVHVHCHFATHAALAGFIIRRLTGIPYSFTAQGSDLHVDRTMLCTKLTEATFAVAISEYNRTVITRECGDEILQRVRVIHSGIDTDYFSPNGKRRNDSFVVLCIGTLHEVKGQAYLIDACRRLQEAGVRFDCMLVGDGPDRASLSAQIVRDGLTERVTLCGPLARAQVAEQMKHAHVLVAPSVPTAEGKREGIPIVLMEAAASGLPVVASEISGIPELVENENTGLLVPPRDPEALAAALQRLAGDPALCRRLGAAGRDRVVQQFDAYSNAAQLAREIRAALERAAGGGSSSAAATDDAVATEPPSGG